MVIDDEDLLLDRAEHFLVAAEDCFDHQGVDPSLDSAGVVTLVISMMIMLTMIMSMIVMMITTTMMIMVMMTMIMVMTMMIWTLIRLVL